MKLRFNEKTKAQPDPKVSDGVITAKRFETHL